MDAGYCLYVHIFVFFGRRQISQAQAKASMPGSITHKVILNYNNVSDSVLHYDFRFLPIELESHI